VFSADGDVAALARLIAARRPGVVLHPSARTPAGDLAGALRAAGVEARASILYETTPTGLAAPPAAAIALLHSPRAARELALLVERHPAPGLRALCLSPAVARPVKGSGLAGVTCCHLPH